MNIRNFSVIAHIDAGKTTLTDRLLEITGTIKKGDRLLDSMELEKEKGITIKLKPVRLQFKFKVHPPTGGSKFKIVDNKKNDSDAKTYILNLIDTPGHVDFTYEVSRSLAACEGALLIVDGVKGIQAQTIANTFQAQKLGLTIIPVINKIDLASTDINYISQDLISTFGFLKDQIINASAKTGENVESVLQAIIERIPAPAMDEKKPLRGLIFDSFYDEHLGVLAYIRIVDGKLSLSPSSKYKFIQTGTEFEPSEIGVFTTHQRSGAWPAPSRIRVNSLSAGEVGYVATGLKDIKKVRVGDTLVEKTNKKEPNALPGYKEIKQMVFAGFYPLDTKDYTNFQRALNRLSLNDSSFSFVSESSPALGNGFRVGFLGLLHSEIIQERIEREYAIDLFSTAPSVLYKVLLKNLKYLEIRSASQLPDKNIIDKIFEPWIRLTIYTPQSYMGGILKLCEDRGGEYVSTEYIGEGSAKRVKLIYNVALREFIIDFYDKLKSVSSGFASLDYRAIKDREVDAVRLDFLVDGRRVEPLSQVVVKKNAQRLAREVLKKLKELIPKQQYGLSLQAAVGGKVLARENISELRKNVTAKLYGGDRTRKDKLVKKQKEGKKRLKRFGKVEIPQEVFREILKT